MIEAEAMAGIYRLMFNKQWRPKSTNFGHATKVSGHGTRPRVGNWYISTKICLSQAIHSELPLQVWMVEWAQTRQKLFIYNRSFTHIKLDMSIKKYNYNSLQFIYYNKTHNLLASIQHNKITELCKLKNSFVSGICYHKYVCLYKYANLNTHYCTDLVFKNSSSVYNYVLKKIVFTF